MYRAVESTKICSVPRIFKAKCKLFMCAIGKHKTKRKICSVPRIFKAKCKLFMCAKGKHKTKGNNSPC